MPTCDIRSEEAQPFFQPEFSSLGDPLPSHGSSSSEASKPKDEHSSFDNISHPVVIEMFCGTARVTACLKAIGLNDSFGVDHIKSKAVSTMKVADLSTKVGQDLFLEWLESPLVMGVFIAPPCGTCSLARCIKLRDDKGRLLPGPVPLRSQLFPEGLPNLSQKNRIRVSLANKLYDFVGRVVKLAISKGLVVVVENPRSSLFWATRWWRECSSKMMYTAHQACAYGSERPKWTVLAHSHKNFCKINHCCPGESSSHRHKPWGLNDDRTFATSEETAYPLKLAGTIAATFGEVFAQKGWIPPVTSMNMQWDKMTLLHARVSSGHQPTASKIPPLVAEHKNVIVLKGPLKDTSKTPVMPMQRLKSNWVIPANLKRNCFVNEIPKESQLLRFTPISGQSGAQEGEQVFEDSGEQAWGVPHTPQEFVSVACKRGHPKNFENLLPPVLKDAVLFNSHKHLSELVELRAKWFKKWVQRAKELEDNERQIKSAMPKHLSRILAPKRILLWSEMLKEAGYPDPGVVDELINGTELVGTVPASGIFGTKFKPADMSVAQLRNLSFAERTKNFYSSRSSGDDEVDRVVYEKTIEEVSAGWATGPFSLEDLPEQCILSRRFGLRQTSKIRLIDGLSGSSVNASVQTVESPKPHTTDVVASVVLELLKHCKTSLLGRAFDLKSAYRQLGIHKDSLWAAYVVVFNPFSRSPEIFQLQAVPFGATRSVFSFLRIAHSLWWLGCSQLKLMWSNFYDDYVTFALEENAINTEATVGLLFDLLGWNFAVEGDKASGFDLKFSALGIVVNLEHFLDGYVEFCNTEKRAKELSETIQCFVKSGTMSLLESQRLRGRMQFADGQLFGRIGQLCLRAVSNHGFSGKGPKIPTDCINALLRFQSFLNDNNPRRVMVSSAETFYIFTDACYEPTSGSWPCGIGGVIYNSYGVPLECFSLCLSREHIISLGGDDKETIIFEAELLALVVAMSQWAPLFQGCPVVFFVDNNSSRDVAISGSARNRAANLMLDALLKVEASSSAFPWYARVPSPSNPSDGLSRGDLSFFESLGIPCVCIREWVDEITAVLHKNRSRGGLS